jgi:hypothetical protein
MSKEDITELKRFIQFEIADLRSDVQSLKREVDGLKGVMGKFRKSQMDLQEVVLRTDDYIQKELFMNLREQELKNRRFEKFVSTIDDKLLKKH